MQASHLPGTMVSRGVLAFCGVAVLIFLVLPIFIVVPMSFSASRFLAFPPPAWSLRWYNEYFGSRRVDAGHSGERTGRDSHLPARYADRRSGGLCHPHQKTRATEIAYALLMVPLMIPHIIVAVGVFFLFARIGLNNTLTGIILAHTMLAIPFVLITTLSGLAGLRHDPGARGTEPRVSTN